MINCILKKIIFYATNFREVAGFLRPLLIANNYYIVYKVAKQETRGFIQPITRIFITKTKSSNLMCNLIGLPGTMDTCSQQNCTYNCK